MDFSRLNPSSSPQAGRAESPQPPEARPVSPPRGPLELPTVGAVSEALGFRGYEGFEFRALIKRAVFRLGTVEAVAEGLRTLAEKLDPPSHEATAGGPTEKG